MQEIMKAMDTQKSMSGGSAREAKQVRILTPEVEEDEITVGPALFGPDLGRNGFQVNRNTLLFYSVLCPRKGENERRAF